MLSRLGFEDQAQKGNSCDELETLSYIHETFTERLEASRQRSGSGSSTRIKPIPVQCTQFPRRPYLFSKPRHVRPMRVG